jgi:hypothetical protein
MKFRKLLFVLFCFVSQAVWAQADWQKITTVDEVFAAYPEQIKSIFLNLNLNYPGLEEVKKAYEKNDIPEACKKLLEYYGHSGNIKELPPVTQQTTSVADSILQDIYTFQMVTDRVPRLEDGRLNWNYTGPEDDIEWAWALNRNYPTNGLLAVYAKTGNPKYVKYIDQFTKDWIISSWPYPAKKSSTAMWRGLEVSFRVKMWSRVFYELWNTGLVSPATQLLILSSVPDHAHYARNFHAQGNWLTMEISGLATVASSWPELKESAAWMDYAIETMVASMKEQVYPDGIQSELTSHYHHVALNNFNLFAEICRESKVQLPDYYTKTLEDMYRYIACTMRPDGFGVMNNDGDRVYNRDRVLTAAESFNRPDWEYIASNGKTGTKPESTSFVFPWAGQLVSRSGFDANAHWSFFDIGPWGSGHQHNDKLHLSVAAFGHDFLVDCGRFAYRGEIADKFRKYALGSQSHNVILVDGKGQAPGPRVAEEPISENLYTIDKDFDYGSGKFDKFIDVVGNFSHTRSVLYVRGKFWVVADQLKTDRPRKIEALWHWNPACEVREEGTGAVAGQIGNGQLSIIPVEETGWKTSLVKGQETPSIQGWYSREYNTYEPNVASVYSKEIKDNDTFVWILWPSEGKTPNIQTKVISKNEQSVKVRVVDPEQGTWEIDIPFLNSAGAQPNFVAKPDK